MTTTPRPVLLMLLGAVALAVPVGWLMGVYLSGYGVPLGARVVIGLLTAPALFALMLVAMAVISGLRARDRWQAQLQGHAGVGHKPETIDLLERVQEVDRSPLVRVLGIGRVVESDGISVEFLSLELREAGGAITLRARGRKLASSLGVRWPKMAITDEVGTPYTLVPGGGGGGEDSMQYELRFAPSPPSGARKLDIAVLDFSSDGWPFDQGDRSDTMPESAKWRIAVDLG